MIKTNFYKTGVGAAGSAQNLDGIHQQETQGAPAKTEISVANGSGLSPQSTEKSTGKRLREREVSEDGNVTKKPRLENAAAAPEVLPKSKVQKGNTAKEVQTLVPWVEKFGAEAIDNCLESFSQIPSERLNEKVGEYARNSFFLLDQSNDANFDKMYDQFLMLRGMLELLKPQEGSAEFLDWQHKKEILDRKIDQLNGMVSTLEQAKKGLEGFSQWMMPFFHLDKILDELGDTQFCGVPYVISFLMCRLDEEKRQILESCQNRIFFVREYLNTRKDRLFMGKGLWKELGHFRVALRGINRSFILLFFCEHNDIPFWFKYEILQFNLNCISEIVSEFKERLDAERMAREEAKMSFSAGIPPEQDPREIGHWKIINEHVEGIKKFSRLGKLGIRLEELMSDPQNSEAIPEIIHEMDKVVQDISPNSGEVFSKKYKTLLEQKGLSSE